MKYPWTRFEAVHCEEREACSCLKFGYLASIHSQCCPGTVERDNLGCPRGCSLCFMQYSLLQVCAVTSYIPVHMYCAWRNTSLSVSSSAH